MWKVYCGIWMEKKKTTHKLKVLKERKLYKGIFCITEI